MSKAASASLSRRFQGISLEEKSEFFLKKFRLSDVKFLVGPNQVPVFAITTTVASASQELENELLRKNEKSEILVPGISDPEAFCILMCLLHPIGGKTFDIEDEDTALRVLPLLKLYGLGPRLEECEKVLLNAPRRPRDFAVAQEYEFKVLEGAVLEWMAEKGYTHVTTHPDWGSIEHENRYYIFKQMLKYKEKCDESKNEQMAKLNEKYKHCSQFIFDVRDLMKNRFQSVAADTFEGAIPCPSSKVPHTCGSQRDCKNCLKFFVRNIENIFEYYQGNIRK